MTANKILEREDALGGLLRAIHDMKPDETTLNELASEMTALSQKLPAEMVGGEEAYDPANPIHLTNALEEVKALLAHRLLSTETPHEN